MHGHALDVLDDVAADVLLEDKVRPVGVVGRQDAAGVGPEQLRDGRVLVVLEAALVVALGRPLAQRGRVAPVEEGLCSCNKSVSVSLLVNHWRAVVTGGNSYRPVVPSPAGDAQTWRLSERRRARAAP